MPVEIPQKSTAPQLQEQKKQPWKKFLNAPKGPAVKDNRMEGAIRFRVEKDDKGLGG